MLHQSAIEMFCALAVDVDVAGHALRGDGEVAAHAVRAEAEVSERLERAQLDLRPRERLRDDRAGDVARVLARAVVVEHARHDAGHRVGIVVVHRQEVGGDLRGRIDRLGVDRRALVQDQRAGSVEVVVVRDVLADFERRPGEVVLNGDVVDHQLVDVDGVRVIRAASDLYLARVGDTVPPRWRRRRFQTCCAGSARRAGAVARRPTASSTGRRSSRSAPAVGVPASGRRARCACTPPTRRCAGCARRARRPARGARSRRAPGAARPAGDARPRPTRSRRWRPSEISALLRESRPDRAAALLAEMEPDEAVDAFRDLEGDEADELLGQCRRRQAASPARPAALPRGLGRWR